MDEQKNIVPTDQPSGGTSGSLVTLIVVASALFFTGIFIILASNSERKQAERISEAKSKVYSLSDETSKRQLDVIRNLCTFPRPTLTNTPTFTEYRDERIAFTYDSANFVVDRYASNGMNNEVAIAIDFKDSYGKQYAKIITRSSTIDSNLSNDIQQTYEMRQRGDTNYNSAYPEITKLKLGEQNYLQFKKEGCNILSYDTIVDSHISLIIEYYSYNGGNDAEAIAEINKLVASIKLLDPAKMTGSATTDLSKLSASSLNYPLRGYPGAFIIVGFPEALIEKVALSPNPINKEHIEANILEKWTLYNGGAVFLTIEVLNRDTTTKEPWTIDDLYKSYTSGGYNTSRVTTPSGIWIKYTNSKSVGYDTIIGDYKIRVLHSATPAATNNNEQLVVKILETIQLTN